MAIPQGSRLGPYERNAPPEKVTDFAGLDLYIEDPKISRDGTKLYYTRGRRTGDIFILRTQRR